MIATVGYGAVAVTKLAIDPTTSDIVAAGTSYLDSAHSKSGVSILRYDSSGFLKQIFGSFGTVTTSIPGYDFAGASSLLIQSDGKILVAGQATPAGGRTVFAVLRYTATGILDTSFGTQGIVLTPVGTNAKAFAVAVQPDQKIIAAGTSDSSSFAFVRYQSNGTIDTTFGNQGKSILSNADANLAEVRDLVIQSDGNILGAGAVSNGTNWSFTLLRVLADDTPSLETSSSLSYPEIKEQNPGISIANLLANGTQGNPIHNHRSSAGQGVAIVGLDSDHGTWEYTLDAGRHWQAFGQPSDVASRLFAADGVTMIRFVPQGDYAGDINSGITFRAWDRTVGINGGVGGIVYGGDWTAALSANAISASVAYLSIRTSGITARAHTTLMVTRSLPPVMHWTSLIISMHLARAPSQPMPRKDLNFLIQRVERAVEEMVS